MRILVTGASGFVGRAACRWLSARGHAVWTERIELAEPDAIPAVLDRLEPEAVLHLAWGFATNRHRDDPAHFTVNLRFVESLVAALETRPAHLVGVGSQAEYGPANVPLSPATPCAPVNAYGAAKLRAGQHVLERLGPRGAWIRMLTAYGPGDDPNKLLPYLVACARRGERMVVSPGEQRWDWLHVEDAGAALGLAVEARLSGLHVLASGEVASIAEIVRTVWEIATARGQVSPPPDIGGRPYNPNELFLLAADPTCLGSIPGFSPRIPLSTGLPTLFDESSR